MDCFLVENRVSARIFFFAIYPANRFLSRFNENILNKSVRNNPTEVFPVINHAVCVKILRLFVTKVLEIERKSSVLCAMSRRTFFILNSIRLHLKRHIRAHKNINCISNSAAQSITLTPHWFWVQHCRTSKILIQSVAKRDLPWNYVKNTAA